MKWLQENKKLVFFTILFVFIMGFVCVLLYEPMMGLIKDPQALKSSLEGYGVLGKGIMAGVMALQVVFVFLPGEVIEVLSGLLYGPIVGMFICLVGAALGSIVIYYFVKCLGFKFIDRFIGRKKLEEVQFLQNSEKLNMILFVIFFIPGTPKDIITYFIPLTNMKLSTFLIITTIARIPSVITSTISGNAIGMKQYELSLLVFGVTGILSLIGLYYYKNRICKVRQSENL